MYVNCSSFSNGIFTYLVIFQLILWMYILHLILSDFVCNSLRTGLRITPEDDKTCYELCCCWRCTLWKRHFILDMYLDKMRGFSCFFLQDWILLVLHCIEFVKNANHQKFLSCWMSKKLPVNFFFCIYFFSSTFLYLTNTYSYLLCLYLACYLWFIITLF